MIEIICKQCGKVFKGDYRRKYCDECIVEKRKACSNAYYEAHPERVKARSKAHYESHKEERKASDKAYRESHKEEVKARSKAYRESHKEENKASSRAYYESHKEEYKARDRIYRNTPKYKIIRSLSNAMTRALKGNKKGAHCFDLVPYNFDEYKSRMENTIPKGYTWQDYLDGKLHVDHITPIWAFNIESANDIDFQKCMALDNLQLLPAEENQSKGCKIEQSFQPSFALAM